MAVKQPFKGLKGNFFPFVCPTGPPDCPAEQKTKTDSKISGICKIVCSGWAVKSPMCDDGPTRSIGFGITLWPTSVFMRKNRALNSLRGWIFALAMATGGEAQARERRMATEAGVCPRLTAPIPLSAAKTAGRGGNEVEAQDEWSYRECQAGCRRCGAIYD